MIEFILTQPDGADIASVAMLVAPLFSPEIQSGDTLLRFPSFVPFFLPLITASGTTPFPTFSLPFLGAFFPTCVCPSRFSRAPRICICSNSEKMANEPRGEK